MLEHPNELSGPDERNDLLEANTTFPQKPSVLLRVEVVVELIQFKFYGDVCLLSTTGKKAMRTRPTSEACLPAKRPVRSRDRQAAVALWTDYAICPVPAGPVAALHPRV